ncbi:hypothetical protein GALMADRAFT_229145 [Galerina marginata CBS 339.88]|uniref:G-protein coupled receptors family 1 profile domain-containing protein n=1 Tax=Galerina marginata (strain CBS 339.88) TaxID=685588 RepID=A0A067SN78_GALM3|nr:hypothetical protein GALMADRAFT_229145 [Galerina marginata CBS 339.88]
MTYAVICQLPNPLTPMAWLAPDVAYQTTISIYIYVGSLAVMLWDMISNVKADYVLCTKYRIGLPTIVYGISRLGTLAYILAATIFESAPTGNCAIFEKVVDGLFPLAVSSTSFLFFLRVRAIFIHNKAVVAFFAFMWLTVLAGTLTATQGVAGGEIGTTKYCTHVKMEHYISAAAITPLVHDTLVFLAISWRLMMNSYIDISLKGGVRTLFFGEYLPALSRALLQDGQVYYLTSLSTNLLIVIMLYVSSEPITYRTMLPAPNNVLINALACHVFRKTKFGIFREKMVPTTQFVMPIHFVDNSGRQRSPPAEGVIEKRETEVRRIIQASTDEIIESDYSV